MRTDTLAALALVALLAVPAFAAPTAAAGDAKAYVSVSDVTHSPANPVPGDLVTVSATVRNLGASNSTLDVSYVDLRRNEHFRYSRAADLGTLAPGSSITVPLTAEFDSPGTKRLYVEIVGHDEDGDRVSAQYPVVIRVQDDSPRVQLDADSPVANADTAVNATVANGLDEAIRNVELSVRGDGVDVEKPRRVRSTVASGSEASYGYTLVADSPGDHRVTATLNYTTAGGTRRSVSRETTLAFDPLRERVDVQATPSDTGSAISVRVTNLGNAPLENVTVRGEADGADVSRALVARIPAQGERTVRLNVSNLNGTAPVSVVAAYDLGDRRGRASATATVAANPGSITLTGLDVERESGTLHITGSASNVGLSQADSVVVRVLPADGVEPAYPGREYFVGSVPRSDFVTFDVYATADSGVDAVPLAVTYLVDGTRHRRTFTVPVEGNQPVQQNTGGGGGGGSLPLALAIGAVVVVVVGAFVVIAWRNSRGGD